MASWVRSAGTVGHVGQHVPHHGDVAAGLRVQRHRVIEHFAEHQRLKLGIGEPREAREAVGQLFEPHDLLDDRGGLLVEDRVEVGALQLAGAPQHLHGAEDGRQRVLQLVGQAAGNLLPRSDPLGLHQARLSALEVDGHLVERRHQAVHLCAAARAHLDACREVARGERARCGRQVLERTQDARGD